MRVNKWSAFFVFSRFIIVLIVVSFGLLTIIASAPPPRMAWVKPGGSPSEFSRDRYVCLQESQQRVDREKHDLYGGATLGRHETNDDLFNACMNSRGWHWKEVKEKETQEQEQNQPKKKAKKKKKKSNAANTSDS